MAAAWVVAYHLLLPGHLVGGLAARVLSRGYLAVDVFFVLSGFVMALNYGDLFAGRLRFGVFARFLWRRAARLYPLYGTILISRFAYTAWRYGTFDLPRPWFAAPMTHPAIDIPANLLLVQSWGIAPSSIGPAWSISTEWGAYLAFPLLARAILHGSRAVALGGVAAALLVLVSVAASLPLHDAHWSLDAWDGRTAGPILRCLGGFTLGLGVWRMVAQAGVVQRLARHPFVPAATCALLAAMLCLGAPDLAVASLFPVLVLCLAVSEKHGAEEQRGAGPFGWRPVVRLGKISYSLYLLHIFLLHPLDLARQALNLFMAGNAADELAAFGIVVFLLAASECSFRMIEVPGRRMVTALWKA